MRLPLIPERSGLWVLILALAAYVLLGVLVMGAGWALTHMPEAVKL